MADLNSDDYYRSRESRERELAEAAINPAIAAIHMEMANRYSALVSNSDPKRGWAVHIRGRSVARTLP